MGPTTWEMSCQLSCSDEKNGCTASRAAKRALEERARAEGQGEGKDQEEQEKVKPDPKAQYNFSDPETRIMKGPDGFLQA